MESPLLNQQNEPKQPNKDLLPATTEQRNHSLLVLPPERQQVEVALTTCKTLQQAKETPTIALAVKGIGDDAVLFMLALTVKQCMLEFFDETERLTEPQCEVWAETILDEYKHENLGDIRVFLKYASMAKYGGDNKGKSFGRLTAMKLNSWIAEYFDEKSELQEKERLKAKTPNSHNDVDLRLVEAMKKSRIGAPDALEWARVARLKKIVGEMDVEQLATAWDNSKTQATKHVIEEEGRRRGLIN